MQLHNSPGRYGLVTKALHWLTATLILGLVALGWYMVDLTYFDRWYNQSLLTHKALGMAVLVLGFITLAWRALSPSPAALPGLPPWQRRASTAVHHLLFVMIFLLPVSGYLISTSAGKSIDFFGWFSIPPLIEVGGTLRDVAIETHFWLAYGTAVLAALHAGAALKHHFIDRDDTLARMIWR